MAEIMFNLAMADDEEVIHSSINSVVARRFPNVSLQHFYDTDSLKDALYDKPTRFDALLLDVTFPLGESGIEALPKIREYAPGLVIFLLTAERNPDEIQYAWPYKIEYMPKPIDENIFVNQFQSAIYRKEEYMELYRELYGKIEEQASYIKALESEKIPQDLKFLMSKIFSDVEFAPKALAQLFKVNFDKRIMSEIRVVDWRLEPSPGARFHIRDARKKEWYCRFSGEGRMFFQFRENDKPLIVEIDPFHRLDP